MAGETNQEELLRNVLERVIQNNRQVRPGTPMAELRSAIEAALSALPPLEFEEFTQAIGDTAAAERFVRNAPEIIGWNADQIVEWIEELSKKV
jgi:hypothetical protein